MMRDAIACRAARGAWGIAFAAGIVIAAPRVAAARQVEILDVTYTHTAALRDSHYRAQPLREMPGNWVSPVDFTRGELWVRLHVLTKPSDVATIIQICMEGLTTAANQPTYACTSFSPRYTTPGVYAWGTTFGQMYAPAPPSFTHAPGPMAIIMKRKDATKPQSTDPDIGDYVPSDLHVTMTLVPAGEAYVPPPDDDLQPGTDGAPPEEEQPTADDGGLSGDSASEATTLDVDIVEPDPGATPGEQGGVPDTASDMHEVLGGCVAAPASAIVTLATALMGVRRRRRCGSQVTAPARL